MKENSLKGECFTGRDGTKYIVEAGIKNGAVAFRETGNADAPLQFCCEAEIKNGKLHGTYFVSYTVSKAEFFCVLHGEKTEKTVVDALKRTYYKIPTVFLKLVGEMYLQKSEET